MKDIENDFYANDSSNHDLESEIYKGSWSWKRRPQGVPANL
jgi:hypothetical protein